MTRYDGMPCTELARRLGTARLVCEERVPSTLDVLHGLAAAGAPAGTVVLAEEQTQGRGRRGTAWLSPPGAGIWLAYLVRSGAEPASGVLALRVGMVLGDAFRALGAPAHVKWPNDILLDDRKLAGILCEVRRGPAGTWVGVGVGVNVHGPVPAPVARTAIALAEIVPEVRCLDVLEAVVPRLHHLPVDATLTAAERTRFAGLDWLRGRPVVAPHAGTACGIAADGALLIETADGTRRVTGGGVRAA